MWWLIYPTCPLFAPRSYSSAPIGAENTTYIYFVNEGRQPAVMNRGENFGSVK
jgi:hypothetical protein